MSGPWEKYAAPQDGPWTKYGAPPPEPAAQAPVTPPQENTWGNAAKNVAQGLGHLGTSITGGILGNAAGLGALGYDIIGTAVTGHEPGTFADPTKVREKVSSALTYQPENPESATMKVVTAPGKVVGGASDYLRQKGDETGLPYVGAVLGGIPEVAANVLGAKAGMPAKFDARAMGGSARQLVPEKVPGTPEMPVETSPKDIAVKKAIDAGYKLNPVQAGDAPVGRTVAGMSGRATLDRELATSNATITDRLAKRYIGLDENQALTPATLNQVRAKANKAYEDVSKTGVRKTSDDYRSDISKVDDRSGADSFPDSTPEAVTKLKEAYGSVAQFNAKDAVSRIKQLRSEARDNMRRDRTPDQKALGHAQRKIADALDSELSRHVSEKGTPELAKKYTDARVQLAKLNTVEDALQGTNVSARRLSQLQKRGTKLEGELKLIADSYDAFDTVLQDLNKIRDNGPLSAVDYLFGVGGAVADPTLAAAVLARPAARAVLKSKTYQRSLARSKEKAAQPKKLAPRNLSTVPVAVAPSNKQRATR